MRFGEDLDLLAHRVHSKHIRHFRINHFNPSVVNRSAGPNISEGRGELVVMRMRVQRS